MKVLIFKYPRNKITDILICLFCVFLIILIMQYDSYSETASALPEEELVLSFLDFNGIKVSDEFQLDSVILFDNKVFSDYNAIQKDNGFDMGTLIGKTVKRYTFEVIGDNNSIDDTLFAVVFTYDGRIVGADVHSSSVNGYIRGVKNNLGEIKT